MASWGPDNWNEARIDAEHRGDGADDLTAEDMRWAFYSEHRRALHGEPPVIPGGRQVPVVYREPLTPIHFPVKEAVLVPDELGRYACIRCQTETTDALFCFSCGGRVEAA